MASTRVICFGEILWDILPTGRIAGGAPMNVAYHLQNLGIQSSVISQIGGDEEGEALLQFLNNKGIDTRYIRPNFTFPTGRVNVSLDKHGNPSYQIIKDVAWDYIYLNDELVDAVKDADALVFGSLVCRSEYSKKTLFDLLKVANLRIFDLNLRPPFYSKNLIERLMRNAEIVKMSSSEFKIVCTWFEIEGTEKSCLQQLKDKFSLETILLTKGKEGVTCLHGELYGEQTAFTVKVEDTVGSGDAFLAGFINKILEMESLPNCLEFAGALGALVATHQGAVPELDKQEILDLIQERKSSSKVLINK